MVDAIFRLDSWTFWFSDLQNNLVVCTGFCLSSTHLLEWKVSSFTVAGLGYQGNQDLEVLMKCFKAKHGLTCLAGSVLCCELSGRDKVLNLSSAEGSC